MVLQIEIEIRKRAFQGDFQGKFISKVGKEQVSLNVAFPRTAYQRSQRFRNEFVAGVAVGVTNTG